MEDEIVRTQCELVAQQIFVPTFSCSTSASLPFSAHRPLHVPAGKPSLPAKTAQTSAVVPVGLPASVSSVQNVLKDAATLISDSAIALYRLCRHRALPIALSHAGSSGHGLTRGDSNTSMQDAAFCVCARLIVQLPLVWAALTRRAAMLRPRNPTLWFGKQVLVPVGTSDIEKFAARSHHLLPPRTVLLRENHNDNLNNSSSNGVEVGNPLSAPTASAAVDIGSATNVFKSDLAASESPSISPLSKLAFAKKATPAALIVDTLGIQPTQAECLAACYFFTVTTPALRKKYPQVIEVGSLNSEERSDRALGSTGSTAEAKTRIRVGKDGEIKRPSTLFSDSAIVNRLASNTCGINSTLSRNGEGSRQSPLEGVYPDENSEGIHDSGGDRGSGRSRKRLAAGSSLASRTTKKRKLAHVGVTGLLFSDLHSSKLNTKTDPIADDNDDEVDEDEESRDNDADGEENIEQQKWSKLLTLLMRTNDSELQNEEDSNRQQPQPASLAPNMRPSVLWDSVNRPLGLVELAAQAHVTALLTRKKRIEALLRRPLLYEFHEWHDLYSPVYGASSDEFSRSVLPTFSSPTPTPLEKGRPFAKKYESQTAPIVDFKAKLNMNDASSCLHPTRVRSFFNPSVSNLLTSTFMTPSFMPRPVSLVTCDYVWTRLLICATWLTVYAEALLPRLAYLGKGNKSSTRLNSNLFTDSSSLPVTPSFPTNHEESTGASNQIIERTDPRSAGKGISGGGPPEGYARAKERKDYDTHLKQASACIAFCARIVRAERRKYGNGSQNEPNRGDSGIFLLCPVCDEELHGGGRRNFTWGALREERETLWKQMNAFVDIMRAEGCISSSGSSDTEDDGEAQQAEARAGLEAEVSQQQDKAFLAHREVSIKHRISLKTWWGVFVGAVSAREIVEATLQYFSSSSSTTILRTRSPTCTGRPERVTAGLSEIDARERNTSTPQNEFDTILGIFSYTNEEMTNVQNCFFKAMTNRVQAVVEELCAIQLLSIKNISPEEVSMGNSSRSKRGDFAANAPDDREGNGEDANCPQLAGLKSSCSGTKAKASLWNSLREKYGWLHQKREVKRAPLRKVNTLHERGKTGDDAVLRPFLSPYTHGKKIEKHLQACTLRQLVLEVVLGECPVERVAPFLLPFLCSYPKHDVREGRELPPLPEHYRRQQQQILELLDFIPSMPPFQEEDGVLECAGCLKLFHQRCVGPFQRDFFMGYFLCHTCRLSVSQRSHQ